MFPVRLTGAGRKTITAKAKCRDWESYPPISPKLILLNRNNFAMTQLDGQAQNI